jgi:hypothetical protein
VLAGQQKGRRPALLKTIGGGAFQGCTRLDSITLPPSLTSISYGAFRGCTGLASITLPPSLTTISYGAFRGCTGLASITLPPSLQTIGDFAFHGCTSLASITLPPSLESISSCAFDGCTSLQRPSNAQLRGVRTVQANAFGGCLPAQPQGQQPHLCASQFISKCLAAPPLGLPAPLPCPACVPRRNDVAL